MNDTEIQYENSKRFRLYFSFLTTETRAGTADVVWELDTAFVPFGSKFFSINLFIFQVEKMRRIQAKMPKKVTKM